MSKKNKKIYYGLVMSYIRLSYFPDITEIPLVFYLSVVSITAKETSRVQDNSFLYGFGHNSSKYFFAIICKTNEEKSMY